MRVARHRPAASTRWRPNGSDRRCVYCGGPTLITLHAALVAMSRGVAGRGGGCVGVGCRPYWVRAQATRYNNGLRTDACGLQLNRTRAGRGGGGGGAGGGGSWEGRAPSNKDHHDSICITCTVDLIIFFLAFPDNCTVLLCYRGPCCQQAGCQCTACSIAVQNLLNHSPASWLSVQI